LLQANKYKTEEMKVHKKNPSWMAGGMATMLLCTLLFSCNNEDFLESGNPEKACDNICFGISSDKNVQTRGYAGGNGPGYTAGRFVSRSDDSADTLCVRAIVSDGINVSGFEGEQALTRGTPVGNDNFYDKFHVLAYWSKNGASVDQFYMNTNASNAAASVGTGAIWSTEQIYYWPGADHSFQFYAWAPTDASGLVTPTTPETKTLAYTVPEAAADQKDIVVATTNEIQGDNNAAVSLTFKHICTAVRFAVGSQMQPGSIKSVALKGVKDAGTYDMAAGTWTLDNTGTTNFSQDLDKSMNGNETDGTEITSPEGTFMMLPQTLPAGATVEVVFVNANNQERTLTASIENTVWTMGTTVTYKLSITPEYELEFSDIPTEVDAHYDIIPIKINAKDVEGNWTITSNQAWVTVKSALTSYEKDGYWLNATGDYSDYCTSEGVAVERQQTLDKSGNGEVELYLFVSENSSTTDRTVALTLSKDGREAAKVEVVQKCPNWQGDLGWEVIEEDLTLPYGFKWDRKVTYQKSGFGFLSGPLEEWYIKQIFKKQPAGLWEWLGSILFPTTVDYVKVDYSNGAVTVTIDYTNMGDISVVSTTDGQDNTWKLYSLVGGTSFEGEQYLTGRDYTIQSATGSLDGRPKNFAALYAVKLNAFDIHKGGSGDKITYAIIPEQTDIKWYLPASEQFSDGAGLNGQYWSSTAINDNANAYSWDDSSQSTPRMDLHKVRAVRQKP